MDSLIKLFETANSVRLFIYYVFISLTFLNIISISFVIGFVIKRIRRAINNYADCLKDDS